MHIKVIAHSKLLSLAEQKQANMKSFAKLASPDQPYTFQNCKCINCRLMTQ